MPFNWIAPGLPMTYLLTASKSMPLAPLTVVEAGAVGAVCPTCVSLPTARLSLCKTFRLLSEKFISVSFHPHYRSARRCVALRSGGIVAEVAAGVLSYEWLGMSVGQPPVKLRLITLRHPTLAWLAYPGHTPALPALPATPPAALTPAARRTSHSARRAPISRARTRLARPRTARRSPALRARSPSLARRNVRSSIGQSRDYRSVNLFTCSLRGGPIFSLRTTTPSMH